MKIENLSKCDLMNHMKNYKKSHCKPIYKLKKDELIQLMVDLGLPISKVQKSECKKYKRKQRVPRKRQLEKLYKLPEEEYSRIQENIIQTLKRPKILPEMVAVPELTPEQEQFLEEKQDYQNYTLKQIKDIAKNYNIPLTRGYKKGTKTRAELISDILKVKPQALTGNGAYSGGRRKRIIGGCDNPSSYFCPKQVRKREMLRFMNRIY